MTDLLVSLKPFGPQGVHVRRSVHTHGTGCTLASALACGLAQDLDSFSASEQAVRYVAGAMEHAPGYGGGHAPEITPGKPILKG